MGGVYRAGLSGIHPRVPGSDLLLLGLVTAALLALVAGGLRFLHGTAGPVERLRAWGEARGVVRGDGVSTALEVAGARGTRRFTVGYQHPPGAAAVLLAAVDCAAADARVDDGVLAVRMTRPDPALLDGPRLDALVDELCALAVELEATAPAGDTPPEE